jgi:prepilin-type N-terminal cleavage/methylation domain-containing protein
MKPGGRRGRVRRSLGKGGFTMIELMIVIAIIMTLAALLMSVADAARRRARMDKTNAILDLLATACERYWSLYHDYPYPNPDFVGIGSNTLGANAAFRAAYYSGGWQDGGFNVALVYMLSVPRTPEPLINLMQGWFKKTTPDMTGPDGRRLYQVLDGFGNVIRVDRPAQTYAVNTYVKVISAGADGKFGADDNDVLAKDNLSRYVRR